MPKLKRKMVQCATLVNRNAVSRTSINGAEHIIVSSFTLPDNIIMNGGLYPAEEIAASFKTLERTLSPIEHPTDSNGNYISASDPEAIHNFHAGAFNVNVTQKEGRIHIEKHINVQEALKTDRGKRLMDRIEELENNANPRPVHTSVGVFLEVEDLDKPQTNAAGEEFTWVARSMFFDHDAILLDSVAAAQPSQGVGMAVNSEGEEIEVEHVLIDQPEASPDVPPDRPATNDMRQNAEGDSFASIMEQIQQKINGIVTADWIYLVDVFDGEAIFETPQGFFQVPWNMAEGEVVLAGIPVRVDRVVKYEPKINSQKEGDDKMKELILNALAEAGIETDGLSDDQLFAKYNELQAANTQSAADEGADAITQAVTNAVKPLTEKIEELTTQVNASADAELVELAKLVGNSDKFPGLDEEAAKLLPVEKLKEMAANCGIAHGVPLTTNKGGQDEGYKAPADMPK